jgi:uncharacterized phage infection (PIP) family protein YhgE
MTEIVASVKRVTDIIGEVSAAASEQNSGLGQINSAVANLEKTTQQNAALVEQSSAATQSLQEQAERLAQAVSIFQAGHAHGAVGVPSVKALAPARNKPPQLAAPKPAAQWAPQAAQPPHKAALTAARPAAAATPAAPVVKKSEPKAAPAPAVATAADDDDWQTF